MKPELHIICGLPASGKTTLAERLERDVPGVRLSPDEWITAVFETARHEEISDGYRDRIEALQWRLGQRMLRAGCGVIVEWGTWGRDERDRLRDAARSEGAAVFLHYLAADPSELRRRIVARNDTLGDDELYMDSERLDGWMDEWASLIEISSAEEFATYDGVPQPS